MDGQIDGSNTNQPVFPVIQCGVCGAFFSSNQTHVCTNAPRSTSAPNVVVWTEQSGVCPTCHRPLGSDEKGSPST